MMFSNRYRVLVWSLLAFAAGGCGGGGSSRPMEMPPPTAPANAAPTSSAVADQMVDEDGISAPIEVTVSDAESSPSELDVSAAADDSSLLPPEGIDLAGAGARRVLTLIPAAGRTGSTDVTITVADAGGASTSTRFRVTVNPLIRAEFSTWMRGTLLARGELDTPIGELHDDGSPLGELEDIPRLRFTDATVEDQAAYDDLLPQ